MYRTSEGLSRLLACSDAVVAIALTLLVLPLTDAAGEADDSTAWEFIQTHSALLTSFLISFGVIAGFWWHHHQMAEYFARYDGVVVALNMVWLLMIVILPFTTELGSVDVVTGSNVLYVAVLTIAAAALSAMYAWARHHPLLLVEGRPREEFVAATGGWMTVAVMAAALVITAIWPSSGSWPLLLLLTIGPLERMVAARSRRTSATS